MSPHDVHKYILIHILKTNGEDLVRMSLRRGEGGKGHLLQYVGFPRLNEDPNT